MIAVYVVGNVCLLCVVGSPDHVSCFLGMVGGPEVPDLSDLAGRPLDDAIAPIDAIIETLQGVRDAVPVP